MTPSTLFLTFGDSWTFGKGVSYYKGISKNVYEKQLVDEHLDPDKTSKCYRKILAKKFNLFNVNFSQNKSSNQRQFRLAKEFLISEEFQILRKQFTNVLVMHAITATTRNELYNLEQKKLLNMKYDENFPIVSALLKYSYDHDNEVRLLSTEMNFFNQYYRMSNIRILWIDTFNHHDYQIDNMFMSDANPRDLMSRLCIENGFEAKTDTYFRCARILEGDRAKFLVDRDLINPFSFHPTHTGHQQIADILSPAMEPLIE